MEKFGAGSKAKFTGTRPCRFCNNPNWNPLHKRPASESNCNNCGKKGHYARAYRQIQNNNRTVKKLTEEVDQMTLSANESIRHIEKIKNIEEKAETLHSKKRIERDTKRIHIWYQVDGNNNAFRWTDSETNRDTENNEPLSDCQWKRGESPWEDAGKYRVQTQQTKMEILITERTDITPLLVMDWMKRFRLKNERIQLAESNQSERER